MNGEEVLKAFEEFKAASRTKTVVLIIIAILATFCITILCYGKTLEREGLIISSRPEAETIEKSINALGHFMDTHFKGEKPTEDELIEAAYKGYIKGYGDPYTEYLTAEEWKELDESLSDFVGIGVYLGEKKTSSETVILGTTSDDSPAAQAGLKAGDIIVEVDLEDVTGKGSKYVSEKVRGVEGTDVKITVERGTETLDFTIKRAKIKSAEIKHEMLSGNIGYIDFDSFTEDSYKEFKAAMDDIMNHNPKGLIIDLRDNTGGYVDAAINIADLFVEEGKVLFTTEDHKGYIQTKTAKGPKQIDLPVVILVNGYTASASEILTGVFKDYNIGKVVGTNTYGKGVIQQIFTNDEICVGGGVLKITVEEYATPNGTKINKVGIKPDIEVELDDDYDGTDKNKDNQLNKALEILKNN